MRAVSLATILLFSLAVAIVPLALVSSQSSEQPAAGHVDDSVTERVALPAMPQADENRRSAAFAREHVPERRESPSLSRGDRAGSIDADQELAAASVGTQDDEPGLVSETEDDAAGNAETGDIDTSSDPSDTPVPAATPEPAEDASPTPTPESHERVPPHCLDPFEQEFLALINAYRQEHGLEQLANSAVLNQASYNHSLDMKERDYFAHESPEGATPFDRMQQAGYGHNTIMAENLAGGQMSAEAVFDAWRESPEHDRNMLNPDLRAIGIARVEADNRRFKVYWTTKFGGYVDEAPSC